MGVSIRECPPLREVFYYGMSEFRLKKKVEKFLGEVNRQEKNPDSKEDHKE